MQGCTGRFTTALSRTLLAIDASLSWKTALNFARKAGGTPVSDFGAIYRNALHLRYRVFRGLFGSIAYVMGQSSSKRGLFVSMLAIMHVLDRCIPVLSARANRANHAQFGI